MGASRLLHTVINFACHYNQKSQTQNLSIYSPVVGWRAKRKPCYSLNDCGFHYWPFVRYWLVISRAALNPVRHMELAQHDRVVLLSYHSTELPTKSNRDSGDSPHYFSCELLLFAGSGGKSDLRKDIYHRNIWTWDPEPGGNLISKTWKRAEGSNWPIGKHTSDADAASMIWKRGDPCQWLSILQEMSTHAYG